MKVHREQLALDQVGLRGLAQANGDISRAHGEIKFLIGRDQGQMNVRIELDELAKARGEPVNADSRGCRHPQIAVWPLAAVGEFRARSFELHEHVMRGVMKELALFGENESARVTMEERNPELLLERRNLPRYRRLRQSQLLAGMGKAASLGGGVENLQLVPVHVHRHFRRTVIPRRSRAPLRRAPQ